MQTKKIIGHIVSWLDNYANRAGIDGFVVGVSGGIDSAVTSTLCAMTGKNVILLNMPILQPPSQYDRSNEHINWLQANYPNTKGYIQDLTATFKKVMEDFPDEIQDNLTMANVRARLRMTTLYAYASHYGYLVAGTGNKVEDFGVGFFTKYGDGGVDISPIADLMKTEVYELAKEMDIVNSIQVAPPTDGLWDDNRSDEDHLGATYAELEWAMKFLENKNNETMTPRQEEVMKIYLKWHNASKHKMMPIPVCEIPTELK
ncbi:NAD(+) synthase [Parvicella tangerina]|uniref:NH(3)-dependent NAD(+) synthetase n=1 Tax=Parvicella tangerina TaxID=2829795 RepID=A0A916JR78_9FLAO|nr:NAD(+) synthase [Parvicella tangerina]CAG5085745.1 NH(3)-dependent NAD(+) synthetase [Parvicella tangerina]